MGPVRRAFACIVALSSVLAVPAGAAAQYDVPRSASLRVSVVKPKGALTVGQRYTWRIKVRNTGRATARSIIVRARWTGLVGVRGGKVDVKAEKSTFRFSRLAPRRTRTFRLTGVVAKRAKSVSVNAGVTWR